MSKKKPISRRNLLRVGTAAAAGGLAGCTGDDADDNGTADDGDDSGTADDGNGDGTVGDIDESVEINIATNQSSPAGRLVWENIIDEFEERTGHTANLTFLGSGEYVEQISTMLRGGEAPEILFASLMGQVGPMILEDVLEPVDDVAEEIWTDSDELDLVRSVSGTDQDGNLVTLPWRISIFNHGVRGDILRDAGNDMFGDEFYHTGTTWDDFADVVQTIDENSDMPGHALSIREDGRGSYEVRKWFWSNGVQFFGGEPSPGEVELTLDQGENLDRGVETLEFLRDEIFPHSHVGNLTWGDIQEAIPADAAGSVDHRYGRIAQSLDGQGRHDILQDVKLQMIPQGPQGEAPYVRQSQGAFGLMEDSEHPEVGKEFIKSFMTSDFYMQWLWRAPLGEFPVTPSRFEEYLDFDGVPDYVVDVRDQAMDFVQHHLDNDLTMVPPITDPGGGFNALGPAIRADGTFAEITARVYLEDAEPEDAIRTVADQIRSDYGDELA